MSRAAFSLALALAFTGSAALADEAAARRTEFADALRVSDCALTAEQLAASGFEMAEADTLIAWFGERGLGSKAEGKYTLAPALCDAAAPAEDRMAAALSLNGCSMHESEAPMLLPKVGFDKDTSRDTVGAMLDKGLVTISDDQTMLQLVDCKS